MLADKGQQQVAMGVATKIFRSHVQGSKKSKSNSHIKKRNKKAKNSTVQ